MYTVKPCFYVYEETDKKKNQMEKKKENSKIRVFETTNIERKLITGKR